MIFFYVDASPNHKSVYIPNRIL